MNKPELGQKITVSKILKRQKVYRGKNDTARVFMNRKWCEIETKPIECIVVGIRNLSNGFGYSDENVRYYEQMEQVKSILVVRSIYSKPFNVPYSEFKQESKC